MCVVVREGPTVAVGSTGLDIVSASAATLSDIIVVGRLLVFSKEPRDGSSTLNAKSVLARLVISDGSCRNTFNSPPISEFEYPDSSIRWLDCFSEDIERVEGVW
jgi:hypothetical protein